MALVVTAFAKSYDFFLYYFTLVVTPLMLFSGVFFPLDTMPEWVRGGALAFPLTHAVDMTRPVMTGGRVGSWELDLLVIAAWTFATTYLALVFLRRRMQV
jgi:lipooligosaccharide transport system permease protein